MEVTKTNFLQILPQIKEAIDGATFLAIDCELTGLNTKFDVNGYDTPSQYYTKLFANSRDFMVIQFGLCAFRYCEEEKIFRQQAYNFYVFPSKANSFMPDRRFLSQPSSLEFLAEQDFDFNKLFKQGIPFLNLEEQNEYQMRLDEKRQNRREQSKKPISNVPTNVSTEERQKVEQIFQEIETFISSDATEHVLPNCNSFIRWIIYSEAEARLKGRATLTTRKGNNGNYTHFVVTRFISEEEKKEAEKRLFEEEEVELNNCVGFYHVLNHISNSHKLVVGHNMLLDVFHMINKFLTRLPKDYNEFKEIVHGLFGNILDTKHMCIGNPFRSLVESSVLSHLVESLQKEPFQSPTIEIEKNMQSYSLQNEKAHEAGYDAFITGVCLITMWNYLGKDANCFKNFSLLEPYLNKIHLMKVYDNPYIHLGKEDSKPSRDHVLYLKFSKDWKAANIYQLFNPYSPIQVAWLDDTSAYVGINRRDQAAHALRTLSRNTSNNKSWSISSYADHQARLKIERETNSAGNAATMVVSTPKRRLSTENMDVKRKKIDDCDDTKVKNANEEDMGEPVAREEAVFNIAKTNKNCQDKKTKETSRSKNTNKKKSKKNNRKRINLLGDWMVD